MAGLKGWALGCVRWLPLAGELERAEGEKDEAWEARKARAALLAGILVGARLVDLPTRIRWGGLWDDAWARERARLRARQKAGEDVDALGDGYWTPELAVELLAAQRVVAREALAGIRGPVSVVLPDGSEAALEGLPCDDALISHLEALGLLGDVARVIREAQGLTVRLGGS